MSRISFEPGSGTFSLILDETDEVPAKWAKTPSCEIHRLVDGKLVVVKPLGKVIE